MIISTEQRAVRVCVVISHTKFVNEVLKISEKNIFLCVLTKLTMNCLTNKIRLSQSTNVISTKFIDSA